jgi:diadenosine tetraphosphate (Ap4A) HIT family hydrolase
VETLPLPTTYGAGMSGGAPWHDPSAWDRATQPDSCPICVGGGPLDQLAEFSTTWITAPANAPLPGYACVVSKRHVVEPFELPPVEGAAFWIEAMLTARVLRDLFRPPKVNYEIHGNTIPHLHLHLFPRFAGDPYVGGPIRPGKASYERSASDLETLRRRLLAEYETTQRARSPDPGPSSPR